MVLLFYWHHHMLVVEDADSVDAAVAMADQLSESGDGNPQDVRDENEAVLLDNRALRQRMETIATDRRSRMGSIAK